MKVKHKNLGNLNFDREKRTKNEHKSFVFQYEVIRSQGSTHLMRKKKSVEIRATQAPRTRNRKQKKARSKFKRLCFICAMMWTLKRIQCSATRTGCFVLFHTTSKQTFEQNIVKRNKKSSRILAECLSSL